MFWRKISFPFIVTMAVLSSFFHLEAASDEQSCAEIHRWEIKYVDPYRGGNLLRIFVHDPLYPPEFPRVGYWIAFPESRNDPILRGCQEIPGGPYTVALQTEMGKWIVGKAFRVEKLSPDWLTIAFEVLKDADDPSSVVARRIVRIPR